MDKQERITLCCADPYLQLPLEEAAQEIGLPLSEAGRPVYFEPGQDGVHIEAKPTEIRVRYGSRTAAFRALSLLPEVVKSGRTLSQSPRFVTNGVLVDASRNAVPEPAALRRMIRQCAVMGLNALFLYTEDTISLPGYPYFGYMRGSYSEREIRELDDYADCFGVELIPCIQTLAHLTAPMRWRAFEEIRDIGDILLLDEDKTYRFLETLIVRMRELFRSKRIHVGLDEAYMAGLGRYLDRHGFPNRADLLLQHVERVTELCRRYGFRPMMWSDTFYRACGGGYKDACITEEICRRVPPDLQLVAWDYYSAAREDYDATFASHRRFDRDILFAGGAWKWLGFAPHIAHSLERSRTALASCTAYGVREVILTAWGDDGAEGSLWGILPVMQLFAEASWEPEADEKRLADRFAACTGMCWTDFLAVDRLHLLLGDAPGTPGPANPAKYLLYQDVMLGLFDVHVREEDGSVYTSAAQELAAAARRNPRGASFFDTLSKLAAVLEIKSTIGVRLRRAYQQRDRENLRRGMDDLRRLPARCEALYRAVCSQWEEENKPFGREILDMRFGTLAYRLQAAIDRIEAYWEGQISSLPEWEVTLLPYDAREDSRGCPIEESAWLKIVSPGVLQT